jgi:glycosyltransferase involved in cell wall biosynthesis
MWQMNAVYPAWATNQTGVKLIYSPRGAFSPWAMKHGSVLKRVFWPLFQLNALRQADCFHATAEAEYQDIRRLGFRQPVTVIPNGIDLAVKPAAKNTTTVRTLLFLGRIHVVKGLALLLPAWKAVQDQFPQWVLKIVGSDDGYHGPSGYLDQIKRLASELGLKRVCFAGPLYGDDKLQAYCDANVYVLPSYSENFAVTVAEALSMETPSIVSKGTPWSGLEAHGAGWWIDIGVAPLACCLQDALSRSSKDLTAMGRRGREWMRQDFSWPSIGAKMAETYRWLCDRSRPVPPWVRLD